MDDKTLFEQIDSLEMPPEFGGNTDEERTVICDIGDFLSRELPSRELIIDPWLPKQGLAMVHAPRGIGKTFFSLNVGYAAASGGSFLGWKVNKPNGVLLLDGEMPASTLQARLAAIVAASDKEATAPFKILTPDLQPKNRLSFNLSRSDDQESIKPHLEGVSLIIVDNIATLCRNGKENDSESWIPIQEWALRQRASGRSVLFIHHSGKGGMQRGTSSREDVLDTVINLRKPSDYEPSQGARFEVHFEKSRGFHGDDAAPIEAQLTTDIHGLPMWTTITLEDSVYLRVIDLFNEGMKQNEIAEEVGRNKSNISRMIKKARVEGRIND